MRNELPLLGTFNEKEILSRATGEGEKFSNETGAANTNIPPLVAAPTNTGSTSTNIPPMVAAPTSQNTGNALLNDLTALTGLVNKGGEVIDKVKGLTKKGQKAAQDHTNDNTNNTKKGMSVVTIAIIGGAVLITGVACYFLFVHKSSSSASPAGQPALA